MSDEDKKTEFEYDVFISYSSKDQEWVRGELLTRIEEAGLKAFIDYRDFTPGMPSIRGMEKGVLKCRKTLLILTPAYIASEWCEIEALMAQVLGPANRDLRIIPALREDCEKPLSIGALTHIDFKKDCDLDLAWRQLLIALGAPPEPEPPQTPDRCGWFLAHPYPMPPNFTGRIAERKMLSNWLDADLDHPLLSLRALGGFGKSALTWHWLTHDVDPAKWRRVVWWSFYETDASFENFLAETLDYLSSGQLDVANISGKDQVATLIRLLHNPGILLVLDGFERELRAFSGMDAPYQGDEAAEQNASTAQSNDTDCVSPLAELFLLNAVSQPNLQSKTLLTTRLRPRILETRNGQLLVGVREEELRELRPEDAATYFEAQGIRGTRAEIQAACEPWGNHPLSLALLAGIILTDLEKPGDVAAAQGLDVGENLIQRRHHVLETAWERLTLEFQQLLGQIACFRGPVDLATLRAIAQESHAKAQSREDEEESKTLRLSGSAHDLNSDLRDLVARGLLFKEIRTEDNQTSTRFDLHPIVRRYAYDRLAAGDRAEVHDQLRDYFAAVEPKSKVTCIEDLAQVIELCHHTLRAGKLDEALGLFRSRLTKPLYFQLGAYGLIIDLLSSFFPDGEQDTLVLSNERDQSWMLNMFANACSLSGQPSRAVPLFKRGNVVDEKCNDEQNLVIGLGNLAGMAQIPIGAMIDAEANLLRKIELSRRIGNEFDEAIGHQELGWLLAFRGASEESEKELGRAQRIFEKRNALQSQSVVRTYQVQLDRLLRRVISDPDSLSRAPRAAFKLACRALELADESAQQSYPNERDYVRAHWLLGATYRDDPGSEPDLDAAERHLHEALERCRRINNVESEADILIDLARLRLDQNQPEEAQRLAEEARLITERCGYVLQGADAHLELAKLAQDRGERALAREHAEEAHRLATCDGPPDYTYKAAYVEAEELLKQLK